MTIAKLDDGTMPNDDEDTKSDRNKPDFDEPGGALQFARARLARDHPAVRMAARDSTADMVIFLAKRITTLAAILDGHSDDRLNEMASHVSTCCGVPENEADAAGEIAVAFRALRACAKPLRPMIEAIRDGHTED